MLSESAGEQKAGGEGLFAPPQAKRKEARRGHGACFADSNGHPPAEYQQEGLETPLGRHHASHAQASLTLGPGQQRGKPQTSQEEGTFAA